MSVFPLASEPLSRSYPPNPIDVDFLELISSSEGEGQYLVEIMAYIGGEARSGGLSGLAEIPLASNPSDAGVDTGQVTLRYADRHWVGAPDAIASRDYGGVAEAVTLTTDYGSIA